MVICCFITLVFNGCSDENVSTQKDNIPTSQPKETVGQQQNIDDELKGFKALKECFINYNFKVEQNGTAEELISFFVEGKYDLNSDGEKDEISILLNGSWLDRNATCYVKVNNTRCDLFVDYTLNGEVRLIDLDKNDKFIEIACFDEGPSADPQYQFFRYDGSSLFSLGSVDELCEVNQYGKIISSFFKARLNPSFYSGWYEVENNKFILKSNDIKKYLGKTYSFEGAAYFSPSETIRYEVDWSSPKVFKSETVKLLDIGGLTEESRILNNYFVEFLNGEKGS